MIQHTPLQEPRHASNPACRDQAHPRPHGITDYLRINSRVLHKPPRIPLISYAIREAGEA